MPVLAYRMCVDLFRPGYIRREAQVHPAKCAIEPARIRLCLKQLVTPVFDGSNCIVRDITLPLNATAMEFCGHVLKLMPLKTVTSDDSATVTRNSLLSRLLCQCFRLK